LPSGENLEADLANTPWKRSTGLSGCKEKKNMLFVCPFCAKWPFWMPGMRYPVKMIFLDKEKTIIDIKDAVPMTSNPKTWKLYKPEKAAKYVLETPFELNVKIGDKLQF